VFVLIEQRDEHADYAPQQAVFKMKATGLIQLWISGRG